MTGENRKPQQQHPAMQRHWRVILSSLAAGSGALLSAQATGARTDTSILCALCAAVATGVSMLLNNETIRVIDSDGPRWLSADEVQEAIVSAHAYEASNNDFILAIRENREYIADLQQEIDRLRARAEFAPSKARLNGDGGGY
jgi:uncharacterized small protein (DUF1192 family)